MAASVNESLRSRILDGSPKFSKALATIKHCKKMFLMKQFIRKVLSFYFDILCNQV